MSYKRISQAAATVLAAGLASAVLPAATAGAASSAVPLPMAHYAHMLVDPAHQHVFFSGGAGSTGILVTDYSGSTVATVPGETGADGLALSPDGSTVYAALGSTDAVSAISTITLTETARYATGTGTDPQSVAWSAGKVWFGYTGTAPFGGIGSIDPAATPAAVTLKATGDNWYGAPILAATPGGELVAGEPGQSPAELASYDVSGSSVSLHARRLLIDGSSVSSNLGDLAITPDGKDILTACGAPYQHQLFTTADLTPDGAYDSTNYPDAVAIGADGTVFAGSDSYYGDSVYVFAPGNPSALASYSVGPDTDLAPAGVAVTPDDATLFAVSTDVYGDNPTLHILQNPAQTAATLTVTGPATVHRHGTVTLTGSLGGTAPYAAGQTLHVTRTGGGTAATLPDITTAPDGSFTVTDSPRGSGTFTYQVSYDGSAHLAASAASATVLIK